MAVANTVIEVPIPEKSGMIIPATAVKLVTATAATPNPTANEPIKVTPCVIH